METGIISSNIQYKTPRKEHTPIIEGRIKIITEPTLWNGGYVGISSSGFGGTNSHILLKSSPKNKINIGTQDGLPRLITVSGRTEEAVKTLLDDINSRQLDVEYVALLYSIHIENIEGHPYKGYTVIGSEVVNKIKEVGNCTRRPICFVFPGTEVEWHNAELMKLPVFAKVIEKCNEILKQHDICVNDIIMDETGTTCNSIIRSFIAITATQIGIVDLLTHAAIQPDYTIGLSIGELICEYVDGRFTIEETILAAYYIGIAFEQAKLQVKKYISIICMYKAIHKINHGSTGTVNDITANRCKYLKIVRTKLLEHFSRILPTEPSKSRRVTQLGRPQSKRDLTETAAEYYADNILNPIPLKEIITLISKSTVLVDIVPHNAFQSIMTNLLESTITIIPLYKRGQKHTIQSFLEGIGDLYNVGLQPQIANLYPPVQFPVSRGTPMISPLIKWDHSEDYYVFRYKEKNKIFSTERIITITPDDEDFEYLYGHVIDERILLPVTSCLYEIWRTIGSLNGTDHKNIDYNNTFEILEKGNVIVSGVVRISNDIAKERLQFLAKSDDAEECMNTSDIFKKLRVCSYQYTGLYRSLKSASINGSVGHIKWSSNWVAFIDNMVQMKSLSLDSRNVIYITTYIRKLRFIAISRRPANIKPVHEEYKFIGYRDHTTISLKDAVQISIQIALECHELRNVKVIEVVEDDDKILLEDLIIPIVHEILSNLPSVQSNLTLDATENRLHSSLLPQNLSVIQPNKY
ncbi:fatty acid synthase-like [Harpegnathos saltator]|uniref:fatty acid synthase-like n=1 Tax=Harpegnathos saltator TaxID=610380 RepID=UPI000DBEDDDA|nr:fatty acid synthase-like [Harpegnathos saltator]